MRYLPSGTTYELQPHKLTHADLFNNDLSITICFVPQETIKQQFQFYFGQKKGSKGSRKETRGVSNSEVSSESCSLTLTGEVWWGALSTARQCAFGFTCSLVIPAETSFVLQSLGHLFTLGDTFQWTDTLYNVQQSPTVMNSQSWNVHSVQAKKRCARF